MHCVQYLVLLTHSCRDPFLILTSASVYAGFLWLCELHPLVILPHPTAMLVGQHVKYISVQVDGKQLKRIFINMWERISCRKKGEGKWDWWDSSVGKWHETDGSNDLCLCHGMMNFPKIDNIQSKITNVGGLNKGQIWVITWNFDYAHWYRKYKTDDMGYFPFIFPQDKTIVIASWYPLHPQRE